MATAFLPFLQQFIRSSPFASEPLCFVFLANTSDYSQRDGPFASSFASKFLEMRVFSWGKFRCTKIITNHPIFCGSRFLSLFTNSFSFLPCLNLTISLIFHPFSLVSTEILEFVIYNFSENPKNYLNVISRPKRKRSTTF